MYDQGRRRGWKQKWYQRYLHYWSLEERVLRICNIA
jgi:hypothetical protein